MEFESEKDAAHAYKSMHNYKLDGVELNVQWAKSATRQPPPPEYAARSRENSVRGGGGRDQVVESRRERSPAPRRDRSMPRDHHRHGNDRERSPPRGSHHRHSNERDNQDARGSRNSYGDRDLAPPLARRERSPVGRRERSPAPVRRDRSPVNRRERSPPPVRRDRAPAPVRRERSPVPISRREQSAPANRRERSPPRQSEPEVASGWKADKTDNDNNANSGWSKPKDEDSMQVDSAWGASKSEKAQESPRHDRRPVSSVRKRESNNGDENADKPSGGWNAASEDPAMKKDDSYWNKPTEVIAPGDEEPPVREDKEEEVPQVDYEDSVSLHGEDTEVPEVVPEKNKGKKRGKAASEEPEEQEQEEAVEYTERSTRSRHRK